MSRIEVKDVAGEPSWGWWGPDQRVQVNLTQRGGHMAPVVFQFEGRQVMPYYINPWWSEKLRAGEGDNDIEVLKILRGDFFCMPFGGGTWREEVHVPHGESATQAWRYLGGVTEGEVITQRFEMEGKVRKGRIEKRITLRSNETNLYIEHSLEGFDGPMPLGHHATLEGADKQDGDMLISTSPIRFGATMPRSATPALGESHALPPLSFFDALDDMPTLDSRCDGSTYPARRDHTDIVSLISAVESGPAWTCVSMPRQGYLWFSIKDPRVLPSTVMWMENRGRGASPWSGRNCCIGLEETCGYFANGLPDSALPNALSDKGVATALQLHRDSPRSIRNIQGCLEIPSTFTKVKSVDFEKGRAIFCDMVGQRVEASLRGEWVLES